MSKLKLGPLPRSATTRISVVLPEALKEELDLYAAAYGRLYGPVDTATLIPHMLESFLRSDRGWRSRRGATQSSDRSLPEAKPGANRPGDQ